MNTNVQKFRLKDTREGQSSPSLLPSSGERPRNVVVKSKTELCLHRPVVEH
ncbi:hypothetical protein I79_004575 [Cricetulus griseus]|uniref:Uncharacterized protein n=1 Tax=Cricetulus griseus TaxID=10029 RepID=G3H2X1_CRIGR|nr:hypothetical protein I79_004575 [Cricetulus griseus]